MRSYTSLSARRMTPTQGHRPSPRLLLERLEDRLVPSIPDGTILITTSPSGFSPTGDTNFPTGLYGLDPNGGTPFAISVNNPNDTTGHFDLFSLPIYIVQAPNSSGQMFLYVADLTAHTTGAIIQVDPNTGQQNFLAFGGNINGPVSLTYQNGFLYVANEADGSGKVHNLTRVDPTTGAQMPISNGVSSTSTGSNSTNTLTDTTQNWTTNQWAGWTMVITGGTGAGQNATVVSNTNNQLTISGSWSTNPDNTSTYAVGFSVPTGIAPGPNNTIYVADEPGGYTGGDPGGIFQVNVNISPGGNGLQTEISHAGSLLHPSDMSLEPSGNFIVLSQTSSTNPDGSLIRVLPSTGGQSFVFTESAPFTDNSTAVDQNTGVIYIGAYSSGNNPGEIFAFNPATGIKTTFANNTNTLSLVEGIAVYHTTVLTPATTTTISPSVNPSVSGQSVSFTATVSPQNPNSNTPTGTVQFQVDGVNFGSPVSVTSAGSVATASFSTSALALGTHAVMASYSGDNNFANSASGSLTQAVNKAATSATLISSSGSSLTGQSVTFTVTVSITSPGSNAVANPTGTVTFSDGSTSIGQGTLSPSGAVSTASFSTSSLSIGQHQITAVYAGGDTNFEPSAASNGLNQVVQTMALMPDPVNPTLTDLIVLGTTGDDHIHIQSAQGGKVIHVMVEETQPEHFQYQADYATSGLARLLVYGGAGDDQIEVDNKVLLPTLLFGGEGNDQIQAGGGPSVIVGGSGDDHLQGGPGNDILIAGSGKSHLEGKGGDNILIAGTTDYDSNVPALILMMDEWSRTDESYLQRVANLQHSPVNGVSPNGAGRNGSYVLNASTVHDSGAGDQLDGGPAMDWFFANVSGNNGVKDQVNGTRPGEVITPIS